MDKFILDESQEDRDIELSKLLDVPLSEVKKFGIKTPDSIQISDGKRPEKLEDLYKNYDFLNFNAHLRTLMYTSATSRHPELFRLLRETKNKTCLDFGSGTGTHSIALLQNNNKVDMLDVSGKLFEFAKTRVKNRFSSNYGFWNNHMKLMDYYYDVVICSDCLEHVDSPLKELKRIHKAMKKGGVIHLLVSTMKKPTSGHFPDSIDEWINKGKAFVKENFEEIRPTIYRKK